MVFYKIHKYTFIIWFQACLFVFCQIESDSVQELNFGHSVLDEVVLDGNIYDASHYINYLVLKRRVLKVYPYVDSIMYIIEMADLDCQAYSNKRFSRRYIRKLQKRIVSHFREDITNLTRKEGLILSKLIHRNLNVTAYDIISSYRGRFHAFFWQSLSKLYSGDLKAVFNPKINKEDLLIEEIICKYIEK